MEIGTHDPSPHPREAPLAEVLEGLNDLLRLDHDAIGSYEVAIERLQNREHALQIEGFKKDHEVHIRRLNDVILSLGGTPANEPHITAPLKQGMQGLARAGGDDALLLAFRANELQTVTRYDRYARKASSWPAAAKRVVDENALDEERHYDWVVRVVGSEGAEEIHLANRLREQGARLEGLAIPAQERVARVGAAARRIAAEGLGAAAGKLEELGRANAGEEGLRGSLGAGAHRVATGASSAARLLRHGPEAPIRGIVEERIRVDTIRSLIIVFVVGFTAGRLLR